MNFFRLRFLNTVLLFLIGIVAGFILKDRFYPQAPKPQAYPSPADYRPTYERAAETAEDASSAEEPQEEAPEAAEPAEKPRKPAAPKPSVSAETVADNGNGAADNSIIIEPSPAPAPARAARELVRGAADDFFRKPDAYSGKELEMDLQMITAKRSARGWRLNLVHTAPGKRIDYLYADDPGAVLGDRPDLRIGYVYTVRFFCGKGEAADGNVLSAITPTGAKADWATGLSAVE